MSTTPIDYDALAKQYGATSSQVDYDALAKQHGAISSTTIHSQAPEDNGIMANIKSFGSDLYDAGKGLVKAITPEPTVADTLIPAPLRVAGKMIKGYAGAVQQNIGRAEQAAGKGDYTGVAINSMAAGLPLVGPLVGGIYEDAKAGKPGTIGKGASRIVQLLSMAPEGSSLPNPVSAINPIIKGAGTATRAVKNATLTAADRTFAPGTPSELMTRAIRPSVTSPELETAMTNQMGATYAKGQATRKPTNSLEAYTQAVEKVKAEKNAQYQRLVDPNKNVAVDASSVADAQNKSIPSTNIRENPAIIDKTAATADTYRPAVTKLRPSKILDEYGSPAMVTETKAQPMTLGEADAIRKDTNAKLDAFWEKNAGDRNAARSNPEVARTEAVNNTIRDLVYDELQQRTGVDPRPIQKAYGELSEIDNAANKRGVVYGRQNPTSLAEELGAAEKGIKGFITAKMLKTYKNPSTLIRIAYERWAGENGITPSWRVKPALRPNLRPAGRVAATAAATSGVGSNDD